MPRPARTPVGVLGLGHVGLPLSLLFAEAGFQVVACDTDIARARLIARGRSPIKYIPDERVRRAVRGGKMIATSDFRRLASVKSALICVPTPLTAQREPDLTFVVEATKRIAEHASPGVLVILESTTYPGTTREVVKPILEARGWRLGKDFYLAFSPEREDPGNREHSTKTIPKVVGGVGAASLAKARALYEQVVDSVVSVSSSEVAEASKLLENVFRSVNIALVNEMKVVLSRMGIDVWEVIEAARTKPFGFMPFVPGPGLGGHCIPIDPFYLAWRARAFDVQTKFIELAGEVNTRMPYFVLGRIVHALNSRRSALRGSRILILGVAYKRDVDDIRESPALKLMELLEAEGANVAYHDPLVPNLRNATAFPKLGRHRSRALTARLVKSSTLVLVTTDHQAIDYRLVERNAALVVDTRRVWKPDDVRFFGA